jgi:SAM-dependent methyltransferase
MGGHGTGLIAKSFHRLARLSTRARHRAQGVRIRAAHRGRGVPIPPARLIHLVAGTEDVSWFLGSGAVAAECLRAVLAKNGIRLEDCRAILDFGCGVGRVLRHWSTLDGPDLHGADYNPALIAWCREHLPFARFGVNDLDGRLEYPPDTFDLAYALSVFTHLSESRQRLWIGELRRVLRPGGLLFLTTHGEHYLPQLTPQEQARFRAGDLVVKGQAREGSNHCAAFHPRRLVSEVLADGFDEIDFIPEGARGNPRQDVYLLRKRDDAATVPGAR